MRCAESGTFSLHPDRPCQPCVPGGLCSKGLLQPQEGFWSFNPFVPQIIPCPLKGACADRPISSAQLSALMPGATLLQQEQQQATVGAQHAQQHELSPQRQNSTGVHAARGRRQLLQSKPAGAGTPLNSSGSISGSEDPAKQPAELSRTAALQQYSRQLSDLITYDPEEGPFRLYNASYGTLLHNWQQLQCNKG